MSVMFQKTQCLQLGDTMEIVVKILYLDIKQVKVSILALPLTSWKTMTKTLNVFESSLSTKWELIALTSESCEDEMR